MKTTRTLLLVAVLSATIASTARALDVWEHAFADVSDPVRPELDVARLAANAPAEALRTQRKRHGIAGCHTAPESFGTKCAVGSAKERTLRNPGIQESRNPGIQESRNPGKRRGTRISCSFFFLLVSWLP